MVQTAAEHGTLTCDAASFGENEDRTPRMSPAPAAPPTPHVGVSGWNYPEWRADFYRGVPQRDWLSHCAARFTGIEINGTFYRHFSPEIVERWRAVARPGFAFAAKGPRVVTHVRRLEDAGDAVVVARQALLPLGPALAVVLWQLPPSIGKDLGLLARFARVLAQWPEARHALEFRHPTWFDAETERLLADHGLANCVSDSPRWPAWDVVLSGIAYVRLHGNDLLYRGDYAEGLLAGWAARVRAWRDAGHAVHVYFDNTAEGAAPRNAEALVALLNHD